MVRLSQSIFSKSYAAVGNVPSAFLCQFSFGFPSWSFHQPTQRATQFLLSLFYLPLLPFQLVSYQLELDQIRRMTPIVRGLSSIPSVRRATPTPYF